MTPEPHQRLDTECKELENKLSEIERMAEDMIAESRFINRVILAAILIFLKRVLFAGILILLIISFFGGLK